MALPGAEIEIDLEGFVPQHGRRQITVNGQDPVIVASSTRRILARVPENSIAHIPIRIWNAGGESDEPGSVQIPTMIAEDMHIVANPAIRPSDDSIFVTLSGARGQLHIAYIYRIDLVKGYTEMIVADVMNATGLAFSPDGHLYATDRHNGRLYRVNTDDTEILIAEGLGTATGLAFGADGTMYVGDRTGTIYKVDELGSIETFATLEPSVAAYHMAFGPTATSTSPHRALPAAISSTVSRRTAKSAYSQKASAARRGSRSIPMAIFTQSPVTRVATASSVSRPQAKSPASSPAITSSDSASPATAK